MALQEQEQTLGEAIAEAMKEQGVRIAAVAVAADVTVNAATKWLKGGGIDLAHYDALCQLFGWPRPHVRGRFRHADVSQGFAA